MPLRVAQHYSDWVCTAVMSNDVMKDAPSMDIFISRYLIELILCSAKTSLCISLKFIAW